MKIKVLGCSGAEFPGHNPPGFLLDDTMLFDAGTLTNVLNERAQLRIRHIFITHSHLDHIRDITFLADNLITAPARQKVSVVSIPSVLDAIKKNLLNGLIWPDFTMIPSVEKAVLGYREVRENRTVSVGDYRITPIEVNHSVPAVGYLVEDKAGKSFFYTGDTGPTPLTWKRIGKRRLDVLIIETSFPNRLADLALMTGHLTASLLVQELKELKYLPGKICIAHPKPQYLRSIEAELKRLGLKNLLLLRDGQTIRV